MWASMKFLPSLAFNPGHIWEFQSFLACVAGARKKKRDGENWARAKRAELGRESMPPPSTPASRRARLISLLPSPL